jgi:hypothetical protein
MDLNCRTKRKAAHGTPSKYGKMATRKANADC